MDPALKQRANAACCARNALANVVESVAPTGCVRIGSQRGYLFFGCSSFGPRYMSNIHQKVMVFLARCWLIPAVIILLLSGCDRGADNQNVDARVQQLLDRGEVRAAVIELKSALQASPDKVNLRLSLGRALLQQRDYPAAEKELTRALGAGASVFLAVEPLSRALYAQGRFVALLDQLPPDLLPVGRRHWVQLQVMRGKAQRALGQGVAAAVSFNAALDANEGDAGALVGLALLAMDEERMSRATSFLEAAVKSAPLDLEVWYAVGRLHFTEGRYDEAIEAYRRAVAAEPKAFAPRIGLAWSQLAVHRLDAVGDQANAVLRQHPKHPSANYLLAAVAFEQSKYELAGTYLQEVLRVAPKDSRALLLAAINSHAAGNPAQAESRLHEFLELQSDFVPAQTLLAELRVLQGHAGKAYRGLLYVARQAGLEQELALHLARLALHNGLPLEGRAWLKMVVDAGNRDPAVQRAKAKLDQGFIKQALSQLESTTPFGDRPVFTSAGVSAHERREEMRSVVTLLRAHDFASALQRAGVLALPGDAGARNLLGIAQAAIGDVEAARQSFEQALELSSSQDQELGPALNLVWLEIALGNYTDARERLDRLQSTTPVPARVLNARAHLAVLEDRHDDAIEWLQKALDVDPASVPTRLILTRLLLLRGDLGQARAAIQPAYRLQPDASAVLALMTEIKERSAPDLVVESGRVRERTDLDDADDPGDVPDALEKWVADNPNHLAGRQALAAAYLNASRPREALQHLVWVEARYPDNVAALNNLAIAYAGLGDIGSALIYAENANQADAENGEVEDTWGWLLVLSGRPDEGLELLEQSIKRLPGNLEIRYHLAEALLRVGRETEAFEQLARALAGGQGFFGDDLARKLFARLQSDDAGVGASKETPASPQ